MFGGLFDIERSYKMKWNARNYICAAIAIFMILLATAAPRTCALSEESERPVTVYVTAKALNGRAKPSKKSMIEALFDRGDELEAWRWSEKHHWIEVTGGECGRVWVCWEYVAERTDESIWWNGSGKKVKIRKAPFGTVIGYLGRDKEVVIDRIVLGWGHCPRGWIDLRYLTEED